MTPQEDVSLRADTVRLSVPVDTGSRYDPHGIAGKTILITGGASGFGAAFAKSWAEYGANIIIGDVDEVAGAALIADLRESTGSLHHHFQYCDVTSWHSQVSLFQAALRLSATGRIDVVVPNAGIAEDPGLLQTNFENPQDLDQERPPAPRFRVLDVNLTGVMYTVHLALFWLQRKSPIESNDDGDGGKGQHARVHPDRHILLIGSIAGLMPLTGAVQYTASKHAVTGLFRCLRGTAYQRGIRVNMLCPCFVDTNMLANAVMLGLAGGGLGEISDVVDAATRFLADETICGRAVVIGPRMTVEDGDHGEIRLVAIPKEEEGGKGIWDCYAHDYENVEAFFYRYTRLLVAFARMRGWAGWLRDVLWVLFRRKQK
jgi:NAD(P)-dependent dehydrogenase (short-subunit alcohol dehydrogenase family)